MESATLYVPEPVPTLGVVSATYDQILAHPEQFFQVSDEDFTFSSEKVPADFGSRDLILFG